MTLSTARLPFHEWAAHYMRVTENQRPTTRARDEFHLKVHVLPRFGDDPLQAIAPVDLQVWVRELSTWRPRELPPAISCSHES